MPLGIVSDDDFDKELKDLTLPSGNKKEEKPIEDKLIDLGIVLPVNSNIGRGKGSIETPDSLRKLIGIESLTDGRESALTLAKDFNIRPSSVSAYANGATSTATYETKPNENVIKSAKERIASKAKKKLNLALSHITDNKLASAKLKDISSVARDMSAVVKNMEDNDKNGKSNNTLNNPQFIFYSPTINKEEQYEVITVKD